MCFNREGPYQDRPRIPRDTPFEVMTDSERHPYNNAVGAFSEKEYVPVSDYHYD